MTSCGNGRALSTGSSRTGRRQGGLGRLRRGSVATPGSVYASGVSRLALLDSARHKLALARYHADALEGILEQHPHDGPDEPLRVPLEAHLEGLAYTGTAAAEKTIRSIDPERIRSDASIAQMIRIAKSEDQSLEHREFGREFEAWWMGTQRRTRHAQVARDLRNDAAHDVYEKAPDGPCWRMQLEGQRPVPLEGLVDRAEELATAVSPAER